MVLLIILRIVTALVETVLRGRAEPVFGGRYSLSAPFQSSLRVPANRREDIFWGEFGWTYSGMTAAQVIGMLCAVLDEVR